MTVTDIPPRAEGHTNKRLSPGGIVAGALVIALAVIGFITTFLVTTGDLVLVDRSWNDADSYYEFESMYNDRNNPFVQELMEGERLISPETDLQVHFRPLPDGTIVGWSLELCNIHGLNNLHTLNDEEWSALTRWEENNASDVVTYDHTIFNNEGVTPGLISEYDDPADNGTLLIVASTPPGSEPWSYEQAARTADQWFDEAGELLPYWCTPPA